MIYFLIGFSLALLIFWYWRKQKRQDLLYLPEFNYTRFRDSAKKMRVRFQWRDEIALIPYRNMRR